MRRPRRATLMRRPFRSRMPADCRDRLTADCCPPRALSRTLPSAPAPSGVGRCAVTLGLFWTACGMASAHRRRSGGPLIFGRRGLHERLRLSKLPPAFVAIADDLQHQLAVLRVVFHHHQRFLDNPAATAPHYCSPFTRGSGRITLTAGSRLCRHHLVQTIHRARASWHTACAGLSQVRCTVRFL